MQSAHEVQLEAVALSFLLFKAVSAREQRAACTIQGLCWKALLPIYGPLGHELRSACVSSISCHRVTAARAKP